MSTVSSSKEIPSLLIGITQLGLDSDLQFEMFKPLRKIQGYFYSLLPIHLKIKGTKAYIEKFVKSISELNEHVTVHNLPDISCSISGTVVADLVIVLPEKSDNDFVYEEGHHLSEVSKIRSLPAALVTCL